jgi:microcystin-dependent protein
MTIVRNFAILAANVSSSGVISGYNGGTITGELKMWPTATAPVGYLLCNGALVSRTTYADLFAVIGTTYGAGDGSTTFALPNFQDRMPIGAGISYSANTTGGTANSVVVSHTHSASHGLTFSGDAMGGHSHGVPIATSGTVVNSINAPSGSFSGSSVSTASVSAGTPTGTISGSVTNANTGISGTNANLPPYIGIHFIIRTGL